VVSNFIIQALLGEDLRIYGDGSQTRSFCFVDDLVDALIRLMRTDNHVTGPINVGNPGEFTILELANIVIELVGSKSKIVHLERPEDDPRQRKPDISKAAEVLGWAPKVELREGLKRTVGYFHPIVKGERRAALKPRLA
jgi:UDP-glucuronate decarboxylase